jgi:hypothetical protein
MYLSGSAGLDEVCANVVAACRGLPQEGIVDFKKRRDPLTYLRENTHGRICKKYIEEE